MILCYLCKEEKDESQFTLRIDDSRYRMCKECVSDILKKKSGKTTNLRHTKEERTCYLCLRMLPNERFTRRKTGKYYSACKDCNRHVFAARRRARLNNAEGSYTTHEWHNLLSKHPKCPKCGRTWEEIPPPLDRTTVITADHIVPISRGGSNSIENIQPMCYSCNSKKGNRI